MSNCVKITVTGVPPATTTCSDRALGITGSEGEEYCVTSTNTKYRCESGLWKNIGTCDGGGGCGGFDLNAWMKENSALVVGGCAVAAALMLLTSRRDGD